MNKINVSLCVPSIEKTYDIFIPINKKVADVIYLLNKAINELTYNTFPIRNDITLINDYTQQIIDPNLIIDETGLANNIRIILL